MFTKSLLSFAIVLFFAMNRANGITCEDYEFTCNNHQCIDRDAVCDSREDCEDGSDEIAESCIHKICLQSEFQCTYGACITKRRKCDGHTDCKDGSDEHPKLCRNDTTKYDAGIRGECREKEFQCSSGMCIAETLMCNGQRDCPKGNDETAALCAAMKCTPAQQFQCGYGACIAFARKCDGIKDCEDNSDEAEELCIIHNATTTTVMPTITAEIPTIEDSTTVVAITPTPITPTNADSTVTPKIPIHNGSTVNPITPPSAAENAWECYSIPIVLGFISGIIVAALLIICRKRIADVFKRRDYFDAAYYPAPPVNEVNQSNTSYARNSPKNDNSFYPPSSNSTYKQL